MEENITKIKETIIQFGQRAMQDFTGENVVALTAVRCDNYKITLNAYCCMLEERLGDLDIERAKWLVANRGNYKSAIDTENQWDITELGMERMKLKSLMRSADRIINSCNTRLRRLQQESFNQL